MKCFTAPTGGDRILARKGKGLSGEDIKQLNISDNNFAPILSFIIIKKQQLNLKKIVPSKKKYNFSQKYFLTCLLFINQICGQEIQTLSLH